MKTTLAFVLSGVLALTIFVGTTGARVMASLDIYNHVTSRLELASTFQSPTQMLPLFKEARNYLAYNRLDVGNVCVFYRGVNPSCDVSNFAQKLDQDIALLSAVSENPIGSTETSNALLSVHRSLYTHGENGEVIGLPALGFLKVWGNHTFLGTAAEWIFIVAFVLFTLALPLI